MWQAEIASFARQHGLAADAVDQLTALIERCATPSAASDTLTSVVLEPPRERPAATAPLEATAYEDLGPLGRGGMGEVRRVREGRLGRTLAMKLLRPELSARPQAVARFVEEARTTAQLQHPGIVPVHDFGRLPDGRLYFTMREVRGRTLSSLVEEVHERGLDQPSPAGWSFRRLVDVLLKVCEAVAYAHDRGVVHRDLKPDNVMIGAFGDVLVLDWGLAKLGAAVAVDEAVETGPVTHAATRMGVVAGTPAYMSPEQARGEIDRIGPRTDVYALGAMLYEILEGRPPYVGATGEAVLAKVLQGPPSRPGRGGGVPDDLVETCLRAMARDPEERHASAKELAQDVSAWLEGARQRDRAVAMVADADALDERAHALRGREVELRASAAALLAPLQPWDPVERKAPGWATEDEAEALAQEAARLHAEAAQELHAALTHYPALVEAHEKLAHRYRADHAAAEEARDRAELVRTELLLRAHASALPEAHPARARHTAYLRGEGTVTLLTDPPCEVELHRYEPRDRRLVPVRVGSLGTTPLVDVKLAMGSWLLVLRAPGHETVRYPVFLRREEAWDGVPPGGTEPFPVPLPRVGELGPHDVYVPAGWTWVGGDPDVTDGFPRARVWVDGCVLRRFPATNAEWIAFLEDLVATGREAEALASVPRERAARQGEEGVMLYAREGGRFRLEPDPEGDVWDERWPVFMIDWFAAVRFAEWSAAREGLPWRLPAELEWEKAARGVDGRHLPWGDFFDESWACVRTSAPPPVLPRPVGHFPGDEGPYGVRDLAGSIRNWCLDRYGGPPERPDAEALWAAARGPVDERTMLVHRGGAWNAFPRQGRGALRVTDMPRLRSLHLGVRLARSFGPRP